MNVEGGGELPPPPPPPERRPRYGFWLILTGVLVAGSGWLLAGVAEYELLSVFPNVSLQAGWLARYEWSLTGSFILEGTGYVLMAVGWAVDAALGPSVRKLRPGGSWDAQRVVGIVLVLSGGFVAASVSFFLGVFEYAQATTAPWGELPMWVVSILPIGTGVGLLLAGVGWAIFRWGRTELYV